MTQYNKQIKSFAISYRLNNQCLSIELTLRKANVYDINNFILYFLKTYIYIYMLLYNILCYYIL